MVESNENEGAIQKRSTEQYLTYAKWGLMGIGGLWVAKIAIGLVLNPLVLVGVGGAGAVGWFVMKGRGSRSTEPAGELASADATLRAQAEAQAEAELAGSLLSAAAPNARVPRAAAIAPTPAAETPEAEFDRRLAELERLKFRMGDE
jgi:hypothetical protein